MKLIITESQLQRLVDEGRGRQPLTPEEIQKKFDKAVKLSKRYSNAREFSLRHLGLYNFLRGPNCPGCLDKVFPNRKKYKPDGYWNAETIADEAANYTSKSEFFDKNQVAYRVASELGIMDDLFPENLPKGRDLYWTLDKSIEVAQDFEGTRTQFQKKYPSAYKLIKDNNLLSFYFGDIKTNTDKLALKQSEEYSNASELRSKNPSLYQKLVQRGLLYIAFPKKEIDPNELINAAKQYKTRTNLQQQNNILYRKLKKIEGGLEAAFGVTYVELAKQYPTLMDLKRKNHYLYKKLIDTGNLEKVFPSISDNKLSLVKTYDDIVKPKNKKPEVIKNGSEERLQKLIDTASKYDSKDSLKNGDRFVYDILSGMNMLGKLFPKSKDKSKIVQEQKTNEVQNQLDWLRSYVASPKYLERLRKEFPGKSEQFIQNERNTRLSNLNNMENKTHYVNSIGRQPGYVSGKMIPRKNEGEFYNYSTKTWEEDKLQKSPKGIDQRGHVYFEKEYEPKNWYPAKGFETIPTHEYGHIVDDGGARIPKSTKQKIFNYTNQKQNQLMYRSDGMAFDYESTPSEFINRLQSIRYLLDKLKIYNPSTSQFTEKEYNMMINNPTIKDNDHYQTIMKTLKGDDNQKKKAFIDLMNTTAKETPTVNPNNLNSTSV